MTPSDLKAWRLGHGWSARHAAMEIGCSEKAYRRWEAGTMRAPGWIYHACLGVNARIAGLRL